MHESQTYLVEYTMLWAGKEVEKDIISVDAVNQFRAATKVKDALMKRNRKAEVKIGEVVEL